jgi:hypothetical protein
MITSGRTDKPPDGPLGLAARGAGLKIGCRRSAAQLGTFRDVDGRMSNIQEVAGIICLQVVRQKILSLDSLDTSLIRGDSFLRSMTTGYGFELSYYNMKVSEVTCEDECAAGQATRGFLVGGAAHG